ncbi:divisome protein SepX/GlpR [Herbidospora sp. RD11066]
MSSVLLYLAIVAMWLGVLVPMWLRRDRYVLMDEDKDTTEGGDTLIESLDQAVAPTTTSEEEAPVSEPAAASDPQFATKRRRAKIRVRRRRTLLWCLAMVLVSGLAASLGVVAWWGVAPAALLLGLYVLLLRVASKLEDEQQDLAARVRADRVRRARMEARRAAQAAREAEIIELEKKRAFVFDQYADHRRAVGD